MGDFDECIKLRPDSALAQAQKCFALVSTTREYCLHIKSSVLALFVKTFELHLWMLCTANLIGHILNFTYCKSGINFIAFFFCLVVPTGIHWKQPIPGTESHGWL